MFGVGICVCGVESLLDRFLGREDLEFFCEG